ncbi:hypothetical protein CAPTEDRAFT_139910 [Capitella teleta]|uniref:Sulfotransferase domain-containing protein n=1 Tax=Capitella teleta TaxID=283909 RepID=R7VC97_CAPTE|nr:hypothetical protein CAPTEDRAFT_139910 [Capitella teleta]|eukprot:ELU16473.1 hypothetical protein CAPTEDRAFT_139910 [Capitella teleta]
MRTYPDRVKIFKYETLAEDPLKSTQDVYRFTGLDLPNNVVNWVRKNTESKYDTAWGTARNSTVTKDKWRTELNSKQRNMITSLCMKTLRLVGYKA